ncbi:3456_t:CDS:2 [Funneliformis mosseae]|uniref:3456_t:CDS:1 n=1 Tax=Funneliformis mosseae TaxID=27381 RepID=A0A9N8Z8S7_FUNMO|nr:3456_t:CDS:2 [Funneliformis mosseae]
MGNWLVYLSIFIKNTTNLANVEKCLVACLNNNTKLLYLRELLKEANSETPRNERIWDEGLNSYWSIITALEINEEESFLDLPNGVHILGDLYKPLTLLIRKCYRDLASIVLDDNIRRIRRTILYESVTERASYVFDREETFLTFDKIITHSLTMRTLISILLQQYWLMSEWSLDEIHKCRDKMYPDTDIKKVDKLFSIWGGIPRFVLEKADDYVQQQKLINAVKICGEKIFDYIRRHEAGGLVTEKFKQKILEKLLRDIEVSLLTGTSDQFLGCCFEQIAHRMLREGGNFKYHSLESQDGDLYQPFAKQEDVLISSDIGNIEMTSTISQKLKIFHQLMRFVLPTFFYK